jgi:hypothetical protein
MSLRFARRTSALAALAICIGGVSPARARTLEAAAGPAYFVVVGEVTEPDGSQGPLSGELRRIFVERLKQRPDVTLEAPSWLSANAAEMGVQLRRHGVKAYDASVKIQSLTTQVTPLEDDPARATLIVSARVTLFGYSLPERALKIGGDGAATGTVLVATAGAEGAAVRLEREVIDAALQEAMAATATKIQLITVRERAALAEAEPTRRRR